MEDLQQKVINWVKTLKGWQCELAYRLLIKEKLDNGDINEIVSMLKEEKQFENKIFPNIGISINGESIILLSIDSIENIEHLSPRNALKFAEKGLTVIYGKNGTGKSGYTRILKKYVENHAHGISLGIYINPMPVSVNVPYFIKKASKWNNVPGL